MTQIGFVNKFGIQYYFFAVNYVLLAIDLIYLHQCILFPVGRIIQQLLGLKYKDTNNYTRQQSNQINRSSWHALPLVAYIVCQLTMIAILFVHYDSYTGNIPLLMTSAVLICGASIDASHELIHQPNWIFKTIGVIGLIPLQFTTYPIQHLYLHHKKVGSPEDPITAPKNSSFYAYYFRAIFESYRFNFNYSKLIFLAAVGANLSYLALIFFLAYRMGGYQNAIEKTILMLVLAYGCILLMEAIEYLEHYGLVYRKNSQERPVQKISSWNAKEDIFNNWIVLRFQRHSDHHINAHKFYSTLIFDDDMPELPLDFQLAAFMTILGKYQKIMNPYVDNIMSKIPISKEHLKLVDQEKWKYRLLIWMLTLFGLFVQLVPWK